MTLAQESIAVAVPPRYWWLKRLLIGGGVLLLALLVLRTWWGWEAQRRLDAQIAVYVARGEPIYPEDFDTESIPDDQNAVWFLRKASNTLSLTANQTQRLKEWSDNPQAARDHLEEIRRMVQANQAVLRLLRQARNAPSVDWGVKLRTPALTASMPSMSGQRDVAKFLGLAATLRHETGNDASAVELLSDSMSQGKAVDEHPTIIGHLVATAMYAAAAFKVEILAPSIVINGSTAIPNRSATEDQIRSLIENLTDTTSYVRAGAYAAMSERMAQLDILQVIRNDRRRGAPSFWFPGVPNTLAWVTALGYPVDPVFALDALRSLRLLTPWIAAIRRSSWADTSRYAPSVEEPRALVGHVIRPLTLNFLPSLDRAYQLHFRSLAMRKMAATALAIRLYELDHGKRPETLTQLVPDYMRELPIDPFASDGRALGYLPEAHPPILYSISQDAEDNGGEFTFRHKNRGVDQDKLDLPFFLDGVRPKNKQHFQELARKSREAREDHDDVEDESGNPNENQPR